MKTEKANKSNYMTTRLERGSYWSYFVGQNIFYTIVSSYLMTYLAMTGVDLAKIGTVVLIVKIWDAFNDPIFGWLFDKVKFKSGQKSLPWLRISLVGIPISTILMFAIPTGAEQGFKLFWFGTAYVLWDTFYTVCDVPIYSMVTTMTDNLAERTTLMSTGRITSGIGSALATLFCTYLISEKVGVSFTVTILMLSVLGFITMLPICIIGREKNYHPEKEEEDFKVSLMLKYLIHNKYLLIYYSAYFLNSALNTAGVVTLFASYYLFHNTNFSLFTGALSIIPAAIMAAIMPKITKKIDKFTIMFWSHIISLVFGLIIYFVGYENVVMFVILTVIRATTMSATGILNFMFTPDCAEYGQYKTGINAKGITFAIQTFSAKITGAVSSSLGMFLLSLFNWKEITASDFLELQKLNIQQPPEALNGLWITFALIPTIGMILSAVLYLFYKLNDKDVQIMAKYNAGEISREEADSLLSRKY
ncbi:MAG: MFS transporter [Clostridiales bacterium]|nr:MFS transporter [Clostridiales bacterium]